MSVARGTIGGPKTSGEVGKVIGKKERRIRAGLVTQANAGNQLIWLGEGKRKSGRGFQMEVIVFERDRWG